MSLRAAGTLFHCSLCPGLPSCRCVFMADVYIEAVSDADKRPEEIHRFLIHTEDGCRLQTVEEKRYLQGYAN